LNEKIDAQAGSTNAIKWNRVLNMRLTMVPAWDEMKDYLVGR